MRSWTLWLPLLAACTTTVHEPQPIGVDTYMINVDVLGKPQTVGRDEAARQANAFCAKRGLIMVANAVDKHTNGLADFITLTFRCLPEAEAAKAHASVGESQ
jgi:hypothetical protein